MRTRLSRQPASSPVVTPDGMSVIYEGSDEVGRGSPWMVPIGGGTPQQITERHALAYSLDVAPDGRSIVFWSAQQQGSLAGAVICELPACGKIRLLPGLGRRLRWTPDGKAIAYLDVARSNVWIQPIDGGDTRQLTRFADGKQISDFAWSHDRKHLAISRISMPSDIVLFKGIKP